MFAKLFGIMNIGGDCRCLGFIVGRGVISRKLRGVVGKGG